MRTAIRRIQPFSIKKYPYPPSLTTYYKLLLVCRTFFEIITNVIKIDNLVSFPDELKWSY